MTTKFAIITRNPEYLMALSAWSFPMFPFLASYATFWWNVAVVSERLDIGSCWSARRGRCHVVIEVRMTWNRQISGSDWHTHQRFEFRISVILSTCAREGAPRYSAPHVSWSYAVPVLCLVCSSTSAKACTYVSKITYPKRTSPWLQ